MQRGVDANSSPVYHCADASDADVKFAPSTIRSPNDPVDIAEPLILFPSSVNKFEETLPEIFICTVEPPLNT